MGTSPSAARRSLAKSSLGSDVVLCRVCTSRPVFQRACIAVRRDRRKETALPSHASATQRGALRRRFRPCFVAREWLCGDAGGKRRVVFLLSSLSSPVIPSSPSWTVPARSVPGLRRCCCRRRSCRCTACCSLDPLHLIAAAAAAAAARPPAVPPSAAGP